jgi:hypothetical protein
VDNEDGLMFDESILALAYNERLSREFFGFSRYPMFNTISSSVFLLRPILPSNAVY